MKTTLLSVAVLPVRLREWQSCAVWNDNQETNQQSPKNAEARRTQRFAERVGQSRDEQWSDGCLTCPVAVFEKRFNF